MRMWWPMAGAVLLAFAAATYSRADADLWGHLRYGLDAIDARGLASDDPYSFTQDVPWINHEWLSEVLTAVAWRLGGSVGLTVLKGTLVFGTFWLMWIALDGARFGVRMAVMAFAAFGTIHMTSAVRPQVWTFLLFGLLLHTLAGGRPADRRWLPVLFALWANLHGGWVVGLGVLGAWAAADAIARPASLRHWFWIVPASAVATLATPYGWRLWEFVLRTVRPERDIAEWKPIWTMDAPTWLPWVIAVLASALAIRRLRESRLAITAVLLMLAWSSLRVMRIGSLFVEAAIILLAPVVVERWRAPLRALPSPRPRGEGLIAAYLFAMGLAAATWGGSRALTCLTVTGPWAPDPQPVRMLATAPPGRIVTFFNWGQYALWHLGPRLKVSMDGRRETVYSDARLAEHDAIINGTEAGLAALASWRAEYAWLPAMSTTTRAWLEANGYRVEFESDRSFLAVREDLPDLPPVDSTSERAGCFPG
jgi:hypothetical protein